MIPKECTLGVIGYFLFCSSERVICEMSFKTFKSKDYENFKENQTEWVE